MQTQEFCPIPAVIYRAAEELAQRRRAQEEAPSPYSSPGETEWHLAREMDEEQVARWTRLYEIGNRKQKEAAKQILDLHHRFEAEKRSK